MSPNLRTASQTSSIFTNPVRRDMRDNRKLAHNNMGEGFNFYKDITLLEVDVIFLCKISIITLDKWVSKSNYNRII